MAQLSFGGAFNENISNEYFDYRDVLFTKEESAFFLKQFIEKTDWRQKSVLMYGKEVITPRLTAWYGDMGSDYSINHKGAQPNIWTEDLQKIRRRVEETSGHNFNGVLLNYYRDGNDSVSWHSDNDGIVGRNAIVASVSFGQERIFEIRDKENHKDKFGVLLKEGSYFLMKPGFQEKYQHRIAKSKEINLPRVNLTFRIIDKTM